MNRHFTIITCHIAKPSHDMKTVEYNSQSILSDYAIGGNNEALNIVAIKGKKTAHVRLKCQMIITLFLVKIND